MAVAAKDQCHAEDCSKQRYRTRSGRATLLCADHEKEYRQGTLRLRDTKPVAAKTAKTSKSAPRTRGTAPEQVAVQA